MKTAITVLQEMMVKLGETPEYECITQSGPHHLATFDYRCKAQGMEVKATARSKKEAKQESARLLLLELAKRGQKVPPPYNMPLPDKDLKTTTTSGNIPETSTISPHSYVALLKDLCEEYRLPGAEYELVGDTGPPHMRQFTMRVRVGQHERLATATTKKAARQMVAEQLYKYMRENLARLTKDFVEMSDMDKSSERATRPSERKRRKSSSSSGSACSGGSSPKSSSSCDPARRSSQREPLGKRIRAEDTGKLDSLSNQNISESSTISPPSYVTQLNDFCEEYRLPGAQFKLVGDTGPPHMRQFTMRVRVGQYERFATATTKKAARQMVAEQLYKYMLKNFERITKDFVDVEEALVRAHERAMERYVEMRDLEATWRPNLGQRIADYHLGLKTHIDAEKCQLARDILLPLKEMAKLESCVLETALAAAAAALGLTVSHGALAGDRAPLHVLELVPTSPALTFAGHDRRAALCAALTYLQLCI